MNKIIKKVLIVFISLLALTGCFENNDNNYRLNEKYEIVTTSNGWIYDYAFLKFEEDKLTTVYKASSEEIPHSTETYTFTREGNNLEFMLESVVGEIKVTITLTSDTTLTITIGEYTQNYQKTDKEIPTLNFPNANMS